MFKDLFTTYPTPWILEDNHDGYEGSLAIFDDLGQMVMHIADMEDCGIVDYQFGLFIVAASISYSMAFGE